MQTLDVWIQGLVDSQAWGAVSTVRRSAPSPLARAFGDAGHWNLAEGRCQGSQTSTVAPPLGRAAGPAQESRVPRRLREPRRPGLEAPAQSI